MTGKTVMVTGASLGIGKETAAALAGMGARVVIVCRDRARGEAARAEIARQSGNPGVELMLADFSSLAQVRELAAAFKQQHPQLHVLVNNAGAYNAHRTTTTDGFETTFGVNHLGYFLLTDLLLDVLKASTPARIVNVSSGAHRGGHINFDDLQGEKGYSGRKAYGQSKLANVLFTYELARRLEGTGVTANAVHPGVVRTGFGKNNPGVLGTAFGIFQIIGRPFYLSPADGAATSIYLASSPEVEGVTGKYFVKCNAVSSNAESYDTDVVRRLWQVSEELTTPAMARAN
ncbi:MAG: SDR family oxidoreductase [Chloroflexota bacterium]|nr:SDR family oxidoreductase [Chloroflexota bacterium]